MKIAYAFVMAVVAAIMVFIAFSYMDQMFLGVVLAAIIIIWPAAFWLISNIAEKGIFKPREEAKRFQQDLIDGVEEEPENLEVKEDKGEFVVPPKKDGNVTKAREDLEKLKKASALLDSEKKEGILNEDMYNELRKRNDEATDKLEQELAKASGEMEEKKVYCKKGKHYIDVRDCIPSKIPGYVICQEHNEEIRAE